jgi:predicted nucleic acid-binding protein
MHCTSFAAMRELRRTTVITSDGHFRRVRFDVPSAACLKESAALMIGR